MTQEIIEKPMSAECTMKQYEAIPDSDFVENREYQLTDYPDNGANAEQMAYALTCKRLFPADTVVTFSGTTDTNYTNGHLYQIEVDGSGTKSWKDITPVSEQSIPIITGTQEKPINLATDLEFGNWYLLSGYVRWSDGGNMRLTITNGGANDAFVLVNKDDNNDCLFVNYSIAGQRQASVTSGLNSRVHILSSGNIDYTNIFGGVFYFNGHVPVVRERIEFYAPTVSGGTTQISQSNGVNKAPTWIDQTSITSKQQTYYLTELPTITTSPYAEHDQVVVNNQDVYALETVNNTLTWVKKYSIGNINLTTITGYDSTKTQVLKNVSGTFQWVDEA